MTIAVFLKCLCFGLECEAAEFISGAKLSIGRGAMTTILRTIPLIFFLLSFAVVLLSDGGVYPSALAVAVIFMALSLATAGLVQGLHRETSRLFGFVLAVWLALIAWSAFQALPSPSGLLANPAWASLREAGIDAPGRISVVPGDTVGSLLPISLPFMTLLAAMLLFRSDRQVETALRVFGSCGAAFAIFAIAQSVLFPHMLMFAPKVDYIGSLTAPFVNRNTAATFYGLVAVALIVCFALAVSSGRRQGRGSNGQVSAQAFVFLLMALAAIVALALTRSRGGVAASAFACGVLLVTLMLHLTRQKTPLRMPSAAGRGLVWGRQAVIALATFVLVVAAGSLVFGRVILRAEVQGTDDGRFCVIPGILRAVRDNFGLGIGSGSFRFYFPAYRSPDCGLVATWFRAHNFYLDTMLALGFVVSMILFIAVAVVLTGIYRAGLRRRRSKKPIVLGGAAAILLVALHSFPDFSLQVPGFAMSFALFLGLTATISLNPAGR